MDLHSTLPDFPTRPYAHVLPSLEKAKISVKDLIISDALEIAKQAKVPVTDVRSLASQILAALHTDLGLGTYQGYTNEIGQDTRNQGANVSVPQVPDTFGQPKLSSISTLDPVLDAALAGGISTGYVTELSGESGSGKTQFLLHLLLAVQLPPPHGVARNALYVSTEADLPTGRLSQLLEEHPYLSTLPPEGRPSLENILSVTTVDLETQDHILHYQIPIAVSRHKIGLVVIDSITANYRAESTSENVPGLLARAWQLKRLGHFLRTLAVKKNIAIVVANQVSDRFDNLQESLWTEAIEQPPSSYLQEQHQVSSSPPASSLHPGSQTIEVQPPGGSDVFRSSQLIPEFTSSPPVSSNIPGSHDAAGDNAIPIDIPDLSRVLSLEYQQPFFDGWGGSHISPLEVAFSRGTGGWKAPALGLVWTNQVACRIVLKIENVLVQSNLRELWLPAVIPATEASLNKADETEFGSVKHQPPPLTHPAGGAGMESTYLGGSENQLAQNTEQLPDIRGRPQVQSSRERSPTASPERRKKRTMQVVFSPWTSGDPHVALNDDSGGYETATNDGIGPVEFDPTIDAVEFEILPGGIQGVQLL